MSWEITATSHTPILLMSKRGRIGASKVTFGLNCAMSWELKSRMAGVGRVLNHLFRDGTDAAYGAVFALYGFVEGLRSAPAEEEECTEEERADGGDDDANNCAGAQAI